MLGSLAIGACALVSTAIGPPGDPSPVQVERLAGLCRAWGTAKYFHPKLAYATVDWDRALVEAIPKVEAAATPHEYAAAIGSMLAALEDPMTRVLGDEPEAVECRDVLPGNASAEPRFEMRDDGAIALVHATNWHALAADPDALGGGVFAPAFKRCASARAIVLDLRRSSPWPAHAEEDWDAEVLASSWRADIGALLAQDVSLPASRTRMHSGYPPEKGSTSGGYFSGFETSDRPPLVANPGAASGKRLVVLTSDGCRGMTPELSGLQSAGVATIVHEGDGVSGLTGDATYDLALPQGVVARIRTSEMVDEEGGAGFAPAVRIPKAAGPGAALDRALAIARGEEEPPPAESAGARRRAARARERSYADMACPNREYRLLALFRVWTVMHYFFPYKHLLDRPWDEVLTEFIPKFAAAKDSAEYGLVVRELAANLHDSHVGAWGGPAGEASRKALGNALPPVLIETIGDAAVIVEIDDADLERSGRVRKGDSIERVDGVILEERRARLAKYTSASTRQSLLSKVDGSLLCGDAGSNAHVQVRGIDGVRREFELPRTLGNSQLLELKERSVPKREVISVLPSGFGYMDLTQLTVDQVAAAFDAVRATTALILDMRGYPRGTAWAICARLTDHRFNMAIFHRPHWTSPDPTVHLDYCFDQMIEPSPLWKYTGRIVVLINSEAISQSEHSCLGFEGAAAGRITFIGTPTSGANGDVTNMSVPGGMTVTFSGHDVRHADGRQLQRIGILPEVRVEPTIEGWIAGRDEVLDTAVEFLQRIPAGKQPK